MAPAPGYQKREDDRRMKKCDKRCIANVGGLCAVESCDGPILCLDWHLDDPQIAAEHYAGFTKYIDQLIKERFANKEDT